MLGLTSRVIAVRLMMKVANQIRPGNQKSEWQRGRLFSSFGLCDQFLETGVGAQRVFTGGGDGFVGFEHGGIAAAETGFDGDEGTFPAIRVLDESKQPSETESSSVAL